MGRNYHFKYESDKDGHPHMNYYTFAIDTSRHNANKATVCKFFQTINNLCQFIETLNFELHDALQMRDLDLNVLKKPSAKLNTK